jgi:hypothetical protein
LITQCTVIAWGSMNKAGTIHVSIVYIDFRSLTSGTNCAYARRRREGVTHCIMRDAVDPCYNATHPLAPAEELDPTETLDYQLALALTCDGACGRILVRERIKSEGL